MKLSRTQHLRYSGLVSPDLYDIRNTSGSKSSDRANNPDIALSTDLLRQDSFSTSPHGFLLNITHSFPHSLNTPSIPPYLLQELEALHPPTPASHRQPPPQDHFYRTSVARSLPLGGTHRFEHQPCASERACVACEGRGQRFCVQVALL